jgi:hypothetical protein
VFLPVFLFLKALSSAIVPADDRHRSAAEKGSTHSLGRLPFQKAEINRSKAEKLKS